MLVIRFQRKGKKNQPFFRIVVCDKRNAPQGGRSLEAVGFFNPLTKEKQVKADRVKYWLSVGAQPSDRVHNLLVSEGVIKADKKAVHSTKIKEKKESPEAPKGAEPEKPKQEKSETPVEQKVSKSDKKEDEKPETKPAEKPAEPKKEEPVKPKENEKKEKEVKKEEVKKEEPKTELKTEAKSEKEK